VNDAPRSSRAYAKGFTLIEILVVVTIIAIVTGGALLSFGLIGATGGAARDVERLQSLLVDARDRAELENRDYGVRLLPDGYEFLAFDSGVGRWLSVDDRLFRAARWSVPVDLELDIEGRRVVLPRESSEGSGPVPDFGVDATGEFTPFELRLRTAAPSARWRLGIDEDGELALREDGAP
jgi:general secretion pathway protein H